MKNTLRTEWKIQKASRMNYIFLIAFVIFLILCLNGIKRENDFFVESVSAQGQYVVNNISPVLNAVILFAMLFLDSLFLFWGCYITKHDEQENCYWQRAMISTPRNILKTQYKMFLVVAISFIFIVLVVGSAAGYVFENELVDHFILVSGSSGLFLLGQKVLCVGIMAYVSYSFGRMIGYIFNSKVLAVIACLVVDQLLIVNSWLTTAFINRLFDDAQYYVTTSGKVALDSINEGVIWIGVIGVAVIIRLAVVYFANRRYCNAK